MLYYTYGDPFHEAAYRDDDTEREEIVELSDEAKAYERQLANAIEASPLPEATIQALVEELDDIAWPNAEDENITNEEAMDSVLEYQEAVFAVGERFNMALYGGSAE